MKRVFSVVTFFAFVIAVLVGCSKSLNPLSENLSDVGGLYFKLTSAESDQIASGQVTVTKGGLTYTKPFSLVNETATVSMDSIQVGRWQVLVQLFDANGDEIYTGTAQAIVTKNGSTSVAVTAAQNKGDLVVDIVTED